MGIFDKRKYEVPVVCDNCGREMDLFVPNGRTIKEFLSTGKGRCDACGCSTLMLSKEKVLKSKTKKGNEDKVEEDREEGPGKLRKEVRALRMELKKMREEE